MSAAADADPTYLQDVWTMYFHDPDNSDWNLPSYLRLLDISTVEDYWASQASIAPFLSRGMFFVMREHVYPCWDDKSNISGGCLSIKVPKEQLAKTWEYLMVRMLGETLLVLSQQQQQQLCTDDAADMWSTVNGMSISPKRFYSIIKLWLRTDAFHTRSHFQLPEWYTGEVLFRSNVDNIRQNHAALGPPITQPPAARRGQQA